MHSCVERTCGKAVAGGLGLARQRGSGSWSGAGKAAAGGPGDRLHNPGLKCREIKPQTTD